MRIESRLLAWATSALTTELQLHPRSHYTPEQSFWHFDHKTGQWASERQQRDPIAFVDVKNVSWTCQLSLRNTYLLSSSSFKFLAKLRFELCSHPKIHTSPIQYSCPCNYWIIICLYKHAHKPAHHTPPPPPKKKMSGGKPIHQTLPQPSLSPPPPPFTFSPLHISL